VNHDIKNGLMPLRNVFRHLEEVAAEEPDGLSTVFAERRSTIESSLEYLGDLAANYANLSPRLEGGRADANDVVERVRDELAGGGDIELHLEPDLPHVAADAVVLRRIVENLAGNAVDAVGGSGRVTITTASIESDRGVWVSLTVADDGPGMSEDQLERSFEDFYTTKEKGTGLGLSVVRRLVLDSNGSLKVETEPGEGTRFTVEIPAAPRGDSGR
jgi:signal transduction histidine kinase